MTGSNDRLDPEGTPRQWYAPRASYLSNFIRCHAPTVALPDQRQEPELGDAVHNGSEDEERQCGPSGCVVEPEYAQDLLRRQHDGRPDGGRDHRERNGRLRESPNTRPPLAPVP